MRFRKIDPRIWNDEIFAEANPLQKLTWFTLLTHPLMTPMGAGVIPIGVLEEVIGNTPGWYWQCNEACSEHRAGTMGGTMGGTILGWFAERSRILCENPSRGGLIIIKNLLLYNRPDNPNQLAE